MANNELENLGLNKLESDIYLTLQELGEARTGLICKKLNISNSHVYTILNSLIKKGLVSYKYANKVKIFKPSDPETLKLLFGKKQEEIQQQEKSLRLLIENLKKLPKNKETESDYQYFEGISALKGMILEVYSTAPRNSEMLLLSAKSESWEVMNAFFLDMHKIRVKKNVSLKMIMQKQTSELKKRITERKKIGLIEIQVSDFNNYGEILLTEDYLCILDTSKETKMPCGFMIKNKIFVSLFKEIYLSLWKNLRFN